MSAVYKRIVAAVGANAFGNLVTIGTQLVSLPLFLHYWDTERYGLWLMLTAMPSYFSMADVGMVSVAGNKMTMAMGRDDAQEATHIFQSAFAFLLIICSALLLISLPIIWLGQWPLIETTEYKLTLSALVICILLTFFNGLAEAIFKATHRYATGTMMSNFIRIAEWLGSVIGLWWDAQFISVALGMLSARLIGVIITVFISQAGQGRLIQWGVSQARWHEFRQMIKPSFAFMMFPLSNALSFQGITLMVGYLLGASHVAVFNTYRTLARVAVQASGTFSHAVWAEFSRAFGQGGAAAVKPLYDKSFKLGVLIAVGLSICLYALAPYLLRLWTHNRIPFEAGLMSLMLIYAAIGGIWHVPRTLILSTNQHISLAAWSLFVAVLALLMAWWLGSVWQDKGVATAMLMSESIIALVSVVTAYRMFAPQQQGSAHKNKPSLAKEQA